LGAKENEEKLILVLVKQHNKKAKGLPDKTKMPCLAEVY
jgi:hypothetical protein